MSDEWAMRRCWPVTFECHHEVVKRILILLIRLSIILVDIFVDRLLDDLDGALHKPRTVWSGHSPTLNITTRAAYVEKARIRHRADSVSLSGTMGGMAAERLR